VTPPDAGSSCLPGDDCPTDPDDDTPDDDTPDDDCISGDCPEDQDGGPGGMDEGPEFPWAIDIGGDDDDTPLDDV
jgi:hypothetical protein